MTEIKINVVIYMTPILAQSAPVKSIIAESCQIKIPVINAIVMGINNVINPASSLPSKT